MTSNSAVDGSIPSVQSFEPEQPTAEPLDPSLLDAVPDVSTVQPDTLQSESMTRSASNKAEDGATIAKDNNDIRQEAMALTMEEARLPLRKDVSMREFLSKMDDYAPVVRTPLSSPNQNHIRRTHKELTHKISLRSQTPSPSTLSRSPASNHHPSPLSNHNHNHIHKTQPHRQVPHNQIQA